jgi:hypothetical protein
MRAESVRREAGIRSPTDGCNGGGTGRPQEIKQPDRGAVTYARNLRRIIGIAITRQVKNRSSDPGSGTEAGIEEPA